MSLELLNKWDDSLLNPGRRENLIVQFLQLLLNNDFTKANDDLFDIGEMFVERLLKQIRSNLDESICRLVYIHALKVLLKTSNGSKYLETFNNNKGLHILKKLLLSLNPVTYKKHLRVMLQILLVITNHSDDQKRDVISKYKLGTTIILLCERTIDTVIHKLTCSIFCALVNVTNDITIGKSSTLEDNNNGDDGDAGDDGDDVLSTMGVADGIMRFIRSNNMNIQRLGIQICLSILSGGETFVGSFFKLIYTNDDNDGDLEEDSPWIIHLIPHVIKLVVWGNLSSRFEAAELVISLYENLKYLDQNFDIHNILIDFLLKILALKCNDQVGNLVLYDKSVRLVESDISDIVHIDDPYSLLTDTGTDPAALVCYILNRIIHGNITQQGLLSTSNFNFTTTQPVAPTSPKPSYTNTFSESIPFSPRNNMHNTSMSISPIQLNDTQQFTAAYTPVRSPLFRSHTVTTRIIETNLAPLVNNKLHLVLLLYISTQGLINCQLDELNPKYIDKLYEMYLSDDTLLQNTTKVHWMERVNSTAPSMYEASLNLQELDDEDFEEDEGFDDVIIDRSCIDKPESEVAMLHRLLRTRGVISFITSCKLLQEWINCDTNVKYEIRRELESVHEIITEKNKVEMIGGMVFSHGSRSQRDSIQVIETHNNSINIFMTMMQLTLSKNKLAVILRENLLQKFNINDKINEFHSCIIDLKSQEIRAHLVTQGAVHVGSSDTDTINYGNQGKGNNNSSSIKYKKLMDAFLTRVNEKAGLAEIPYLSEDEVTAIVGTRVKPVQAASHRVSLFAPKHVANRRNNMNNAKCKLKQRRIAMISSSRDNPKEESNSDEHNKQVTVINELQRMDLDTSAQTNYYQKIKESIARCPNVETFVDVYLNAVSPKEDTADVDSILKDQYDSDVDVETAIVKNDNDTRNKVTYKDFNIKTGGSPGKQSPARKRSNSPARKAKKSPIKPVHDGEILARLAAIELM